MEKLEPIEKFNDCKARGHTCKGHNNHWLDCTYETQDERDLLVKILDNRIETDGSN